MITPAPTTKIDRALTRGVLVSTDGEAVTISIPDTNYQLRLIALGEITTRPGKRIIGTVRAQALRVDEVRTGGRFVEPVFGRPRRVQGRIIAIKDGAIVVDAGLPIHCTLTDRRQSATDFEQGQLVSFDVLKGATFTPGE